MYLNCATWGILSSIGTHKRRDAELFVARVVIAGDSRRRRIASGGKASESEVVVVVKGIACMNSMETIETDATFDS